jgi:hypothetical protein
MKRDEFRTSSIADRELHILQLRTFVVVDNVGRTEQLLVLTTKQ